MSTIDYRCIYSKTDTEYCTAYMNVYSRHSPTYEVTYVSITSININVHISTCYNACTLYGLVSRTIFNWNQLCHIPLIATMKMFYLSSFGYCESISKHILVLEILVAAVKAITEEQRSVNLNWAKWNQHLKKKKKAWYKKVKKAFS